MAQKRDPAKPIVDFPNEDDWNIPGPAEDEAVHRALIRAQETSLRRFWEETKDDNL